MGYCTPKAVGSQVGDGERSLCIIRGFDAPHPGDAGQMHFRFRCYRNPYLGNTLLLIGLGLGSGNAWFTATALAAAQGVTVLAIRREEKHLEERFGVAWTAYARRVPRWLKVFP